jgi:hypothetical protein
MPTSLPLLGGLLLIGLRLLLGLLVVLLAVIAFAHVLISLP